MAFDYRKMYAQIGSINKKIGNPPSKPGIYTLTRVDEDGFRFAYVGQAKRLDTRIAQHALGYQAIDLSIKKHGWYSKDNGHGWKAEWITCGSSELNDFEQMYIKKMADQGWQLKNATTGSQGVGKKSLGNQRPAKKYGDGLVQGKKNASKLIDDLFTKHLEVTTKRQPPTVNQQKALDKFNELRNFYKEENEDD